MAHGNVSDQESMVEQCTASTGNRNGRAFANPVHWPKIPRRRRPSQGFTAGISAAGIFGVGFSNPPVSCGADFAVGPGGPIDTDATRSFARRSLDGVRFGRLGEPWGPRGM